ncbi:hypothetical protein D3C78_1951120 [compost metagenome]
MHTRGIHPDKERLIGFDLLLHEVDCSLRGLVVDGFHTFFGQCTGVFDFAVSTGFDHTTG